MINVGTMDEIVYGVFKGLIVVGDQVTTQIVDNSTQVSNKVLGHGVSSKSSTSRYL
jgi:hypothetical protein